RALAVIARSRTSSEAEVQIRASVAGITRQTGLQDRHIRTPCLDRSGRCRSRSTCARHRDTRGRRDSSDPSRAGGACEPRSDPDFVYDRGELVDTIVQGLAFYAVGDGDVLRRTRGHLPFANRITVYSGPLPAPLLAAINAGVARYDAAPDAA